MIFLLLLFLPILADSCLVPNGCGCLKIQTITASQIQKQPLSSFLGLRTTVSPSFTVDDACRITVDVSKMSSNNFFFMIFRQDAPPIFSRRFLTAASKSVKFSPTGISCVKVANEYQWQYYGGEVKGMSFAMQAAECGCTGLARYNGVKTTTISSCDVIQATCAAKTVPNFQLAPKNIVTKSLASTQRIDDLTCVKDTWYFNQVAFNNIGCVPPQLMFSTQPLKSYCQCIQVEGFPTFAPALMSSPYPKIPLSYLTTYTYRAGSVKYDTSKCTSSIACSGTDTLLIFGVNVAPMIYPYGEVPYSTCQATPLAPTPSAGWHFWFVDGVMLSNPVFGCVGACPCKYARLHSSNIERLVKSSPFYSYVARKPYQAPSDNRKDVITDCPTKVTCPAGFTLVVFDTQATSVFSSGSMSLSCSTSTKKFTVDGGTDVTDFTTVLALCVDFR